MDPEAPAEVVARAVEAFGGLDILVNNAGGPPPGVTLPRVGRSSTPTDADWRAMFEFNLFAAVRAIRAAIPLMLERGGGAIVNVSSGSARQPAPMNVDYGAAKAALNNLTKALSEEYGPQGIRVNTVSPGPVRTPWWTEEGGAADIIAAQAGHRPRQRHGHRRAGDDEADHRPPRRPAGGRRRGRAARLAALGEHDRRRPRRRRRSPQGGLIAYSADRSRMRMFRNDTTSCGAPWACRPT